VAAPVPAGIQGIITNPPFRLAGRFAPKAVGEVGYVALLLRTNFDEQYLPCMVRLADWRGTGACSLVQLEGFTFSLASQRQHEPWGSVGEDFSETVMVGTAAARPNRGCGTDIAYRLHLTRVLPTPRPAERRRVLCYSGS
jgi:hypothetical protein